MKKKPLKITRKLGISLTRELKNLTKSFQEVNTLNQMKVLHCLSQGPNFHNYIFWYCKTIDKGALSVILKDFVKSGFITAEDVGNKGRKYLYTLADRGKKFIPTISKRIIWGKNDKPKPKPKPLLLLLLFNTYI